METVSSWCLEMGSWTEKEPRAIGILIVTINFGEHLPATILFFIPRFLPPMPHGIFPWSRAASKPTAVELLQDPIVGPCQSHRFGRNMPNSLQVDSSFVVSNSEVLYPMAHPNSFAAMEWRPLCPLAAFGQPETSAWNRKCHSRWEMPCWSNYWELLVFLMVPSSLPDISEIY